MLTLPFKFNGKSYSALVHKKYLADGKKYRITIMNGELEQLLFGNNILVERDGVIYPEKTPKPANESLISQLINSLNNCLLDSAIF